MSIIESVKEELLSKEIINEINVAMDNRNNFSVHVTPDSNRNLGDGGGYFKYLNHVEYAKADGIARIYFAKAEYLIHIDQDGKRPIRLSSKQKDKLIALLNKPPRPEKLNKIQNKFIKSMITNNWILMIYQFNRLIHIDENTMEKCIMNNYKNIPKNMIRLDLPMPDYTKL